MSDAHVDVIWESLAPHIEWARGFSLILLFASHPDPVEQIRGRLEASLRAHGLALKILDPHSYEDTHELLLAVLDAPEPDCGGLWIPLWWHDADGSREFLLQRLNERRAVLEREVARPIVLVLPTDYRSQIAVVAPDLWVVRSFSEQLPSPEARPWQPIERDIGRRELSTDQPRGAAELEWKRLTAANQQTGLAIEDAVLAFESALERGSLAEARRIATEMLMLVTRGRVEGDVDAIDIRELLDEAELLDPPAQRTIAMVLDRLGDVENYAGDLTRARELCGRSLMIHEALARTNPHDTQARRDLSRSYEKLGCVDEVAGDLVAAHESYSRSLVIREALIQADPHDAHAQRDLSTSYEKLAGVEARAGTLTRAHELLGRSLAIRETLAKTDPRDFHAQRDLSFSYEKLGEVEEQAGNLVEARELYRRSLTIREALVEANPHSAVAWFDIVFVLLGLGRLADVVGDVGERNEYLRRANTILDQLDAEGRLSGYPERESIRDYVRAQLATQGLAGPSASSDPAAR